MKTHQDSIFINYPQLAGVRATGHGDCSVTTTTSRVSNEFRPYVDRKAEFVPASALVEAKELNASLSSSLTSVSELLGKQTETMLALRAFVERIANDSGRCTAPDIAPSELDSLICDAQDLLLKVTQ